MQAAVAARLGYDPFHSPGGATIQLSVVLAARKQDGLMATLTIAVPGQPARQRTIETPNEDCVDLASALELTLSIAIDPLFLIRPKPASPPPPSETHSVEPASATAPPPTTPEAPWHPSRYLILAGAGGSVGTAPDPALGLQLAFEARWTVLSLGLEARGDLPASGTIGAGPAQMQTTLEAATLAPCYWLGPFAVCALVSTGVQEGTGLGLQSQRTIVEPYFALGGRALVDLPLGKYWDLRFSADVRGQLAGMTLLVGQTPVWSSPPVSGTLSAGVGLRIP